MSHAVNTDDLRRLASGMLDDDFNRVSGAQLCIDAADAINALRAELDAQRDMVAVALEKANRYADLLQAARAEADELHETCAAFDTRLAETEAALALAKEELASARACLCAGLPSGNSHFCPVHHCGVAANK